MVELAAAVAILLILATILFMWKRKPSNGEDVSPGSSSTLARESTGADNSAPSFPAGKLTVYFGSQTVGRGPSCVIKSAPFDDSCKYAKM